MPSWRNNGLVALALSLLADAAIAASLWPQPAAFTADTTSFAALSPSFKFAASGSAASGSQLLARAFGRYEALLNSTALRFVADSDDNLSDDGTSAAGGVDTLAPVSGLSVVVDTAGDTISFGVNESYELSWNLSPDLPQQAPVLRAATVFGALRGLETFVQLVENDNVAHVVPLQLPVIAQITDQPRFPCVRMRACSRQSKRSLRVHAHTHTTHTPSKSRCRATPQTHTTHTTITHARTRTNTHVPSATGIAA